MIITENMTINGRALVRRYSDEGRYLMRDGVAYAEAIDPAELAEERVYEEGEVMENVLIETDPDAATIEDYQAALVEMGVELE